MNVLHQVVDLRFEVVGARDLEAVFEPVIQRQPLVKLHNVALKRRPQLRIHFLCQRGLLLNVLQAREKFAEGKIFAGLWTQSKSGECFRIANDENFSQVSFVRFHQHFREPVGG